MFRSVGTIIDSLRPSKDEGSDSDEPFVVEKPWEWPPNAPERCADSSDNDGVVYDFPWAHTDDENATVKSYRERSGRYTRIVCLRWYEDGDDVPGPPDGAPMMITRAEAIVVLYRDDDQLLGRHYTYTYEEGDGHGTIDVTIDTYGVTPGMEYELWRDTLIPQWAVEDEGDMLVDAVHGPDEDTDGDGGRSNE